MKFRITFTFLLLTFAAAAQLPSIGLSEPMIVTEGSALGSTGPHVSLTSGNIPLVQWGKGGSSGGVYTSRLVSSSFTTPVLVSPAGMTIGISGSYGVDLETSGDTAFVCFVSSPFYEAKVYTQRSIDGGQTWGDTLRIDSENTNFPYMPTLFVRPGGDPIVGYIRSDSFEVVVDQKLTYSMDGGTTWSSETSVTPPSLNAMPCECCPPGAVAYNDTVVSLWRYNDGGIRDIHASISTDNGDNFNQAIRIDSTYWIIGQCPTTGPDGLTSGDSIIVVWKSDGSFEDRVYSGSMHKTNFGVGPYAQIDGSVGGSVIQNFPKLAGQGDTLGVVWQDNRNGNLDVFFAYSVTGRYGFSAAINLTDSTMPSSQVNPHIDYADGTFHIVFQSQNSKVYYYSATIGAQTGIEDAEVQPFDLVVAPNPVQGQSKISIAKADGAIQLKVFTLSGQLVEDFGAVSGSIILDASNYTAGVYLVRATDSKGNSVEKRIVVK